MFIISLEDDLSRVNALSTLYRGEGEGQADQASLPAEIVAEATKDVFEMASSTSMIPGGDFSGAAETLLPIISSQRERFRRRTEQLEQDNDNLRHQMAALESDIERLRSDNVKLYSKIKFLQSYPSVKSQPDDDMERRYSAQYEERLDPFATFSRRERQRKYMNLSPLEKISLSMGRMILSNRSARMITLGYTIILHCLVFLVLYKLAYTETCRRDLAAECNARFAEHMQKVHGEHHF